MKTPDTPSIERLKELPQDAPGHWTSVEGREVAAEYVSKSRAELEKGDLADLVVANRVFLANRGDLDLIHWQTAAKERIRWLSAKLAAALAALETLTPSAGEREPCHMCNGVGGVNEARGEGVYVGLKCPQCFGFGSEEIVDLISDALDNSMGPDWSTRTGAKYVADALSDAGFARAALNDGGSDAG